MITVFTEHITDRLIYTLDFCFKEKGQEYEIITSLSDWSDLNSQGINYSQQPIPSAIQIAPQGLLFESEIHLSKKITLNNHELAIDGVNDPLSVIFYLLSRYEEYFSTYRDSHDRLSSAQNMLVKLGLNKQVIVDRMVKSIWHDLELDYDPVKSNFTFIPTFDIDVAWAYKHRKFVRSIGAVLKGGKPLERIQVFSGLKKDPYDTYSDIRAIAARTKQIICFTLLGDWGKFDKNIHWENDAYGSLIRGLNLEGEIGIHPSYASHLKLPKIEQEIGRLEQITGHEINLSRQHFLRLKIPETYQLLCKAGINEDYSMGFADNIGFRAGTSFPFYFFDLATNKKTGLVIRPFAYMDSALKDYLNKSCEESVKEVAHLIEEVKEVGGNFIFIWHNSSIHDKGEWKGWKQVLDYTVDKGLVEQ